MTVTQTLATERAPLVELNQDCLLALRSVAIGAEPVLCRQVIAVELEAEWRALDRPAIERLAAAPFTLLDCGLRNAAVWIGTVPLGVRDAERVGEPTCFEPATGRVLTRRLLAFAWHIARVQPRLARLLLGCDGNGVAAIADCSLAQLDRHAEARGHELSVRWASHTDYWRKMLVAASAGSEQQLSDRMQNAVRRVAADALRPPSMLR